MLSTKKLIYKILQLFEPKTLTVTTNTLDHLSSVTATLTYRGKTGILYIGATNTNANLAVGSSATFRFTNLPALQVASTGAGYSGSTAMVASVSTTAATLRVTGAPWVAGYDCSIYIPVLLA